MRIGLLIGSIAFLSVLSWADSEQNLNNEVQDLTNTVSESTPVITHDIELLRQTNHFDTSLLVAGVVQTTTGTTVDIPLTFIPNNFDAITALQANIAIPAGMEITQVQPGPAAIGAEKSVSFSTDTTNPPILVSGLNQDPIEDGILAIITVKIGANVRPDYYSLGLGVPVAVDASAMSVPLAVTTGVIEVVQ